MTESGTGCANTTSAQPPPPRQGGLEHLHPASFAMVMATGIVSIAADLKGWTWVAYGLFLINLAAYGTLWVLTLLRAIRYRRAFFSDFSNHARAMGFLTVVAGTCVLGSQFLLLQDNFSAAHVLWCFGLALWFVLTYTILTLLTVRREKPSLDDGINGGWLLAIVSTQSVSVLGSQLAPHMGTAAEPMLFISLLLWLGGGMLYVWIISLIFYRYIFFRMSPADLSPPYWINMGAVAISTLAGSFLISNRSYAPFLEAMSPFVGGTTLAFWATATWWIPMLVTLGIWRHVYNRFPLRYDPLYWGAVFPLGMYTACTYRLADSLNLPFLHWIPENFVYIALAAWVLTFYGFARYVIEKATSLIGP